MYISSGMDQALQKEKKENAEKRDKLNKIIQKSNPEIMELKFGCEVYSDVWKKVKVIKEKGSDRDETFFECCNRDGSGACFIPEINLFDNILGRPILAHDIQKILPCGWYMKWAGDQYEFVNMEYFNTSKFKNEYFSFKDKPLHEQSQHTVNRILEFLDKPIYDKS